MGEKVTKYYLEETKKCFKELKDKENRLKQVPNLLAFSRVISPAVIIPATLLGHFAIAGVAALGFALTDAIDGPLARKWKAVSEFGKDLDPVADKIFATGLILALMPSHLFLSINLLLEGAISGININSRKKGNKPKARGLGKFKTVVLSTLLVTSYLSLLDLSYLKFIEPALIKNMFIATLGTQLISAYDYYKTDKKKDAAKNKYQPKPNDQPIINNEVKKSPTTFLAKENVYKKSINHHEDLLKPKQKILKRI